MATDDMKKAIEEDMLAAADIVDDAISKMSGPIVGLMPWHHEYRKIAYKIVLAGLLNNDGRTNPHLKRTFGERFPYKM